MGDNEVLELQCDSFQHSLMSYVAEKRDKKGLVFDVEERGYFLFCQMKDGVLLVQRPELDTKDRTAKVQVTFGSRKEDLSDALFMAGRHRLFLPVDKLAAQLVPFVFVEYSAGDFAFYAVMYILFFWLLPLGYVAIQFRALDIPRLIQLLWESPKGKLQLLTFTALTVGANGFVYANLHDINSFAGPEWRSMEKETQRYSKVMDLLKDVPTIDELAAEQQQFFSSSLQEEITSPLQVIQGRPVKKKAPLAATAEKKKEKKKLIGLLVTDQTGKRIIIPFTGKNFETLYFNSYHASTMCLSPLKPPYWLDISPGISLSIADERKAIALQQLLVSQWQAQNRISDITSRVTTAADCKKKTIYWVFDKKYYVSHPMEYFTQLASKGRKGKAVE